MKKTGYVIALVICIIVFCAISIGSKADGIYTINTEKDPLRVHEGPAGSYDVIGQIKKGASVYVTDIDKNGWATINYHLPDQDVVAYIYSGYLSPTPCYNYNTPRRNVTYISTEGTIEFVVNRKAGKWLNVRRGKSTSADMIGELHTGDTVYVDEIGERWCKIVYGGRYAYVMREYIDPKEELIDEETGLGWYKVTSLMKGTLNVREGAGTDFDVIKRIGKGRRVEVVELEAEWAKIIYQNEYGYVMSEFLEPLE